MEIMIRHKVMTEYGIEAEIWKVGYISLDRVNKYGSITMCLYLTEEATQYLTKVTEVILSTESFDTYFLLLINYLQSHYVSLLNIVYWRVLLHH